MPDGLMDHTIAKGELISINEDFVNRSTAGLLALLNELRAGVPIYELTDFYDSQNFTDPKTGDPLTPAAVKKHLREHWFGLTEQTPDGGWVQPDPATKSNTGWWPNYRGDAHAVLHEAMIRAAEVALGVDHVDVAAQTAGYLPQTISPTRHWPIDIVWKCPNPWFECWVSWRDEVAVAGGAKGGGSVTLHIHTPAGGGRIHNSPIRTSTEPDYKDTLGAAPAPTHAGRPQGLWVVSQQDHTLRVQPPEPLWKGSLLGDVRMPRQGAVTQGVGPIVVVQPAEVDGGMLDNPTTF